MCAAGHQRRECHEAIIINMPYNMTILQSMSMRMQPNRNGKGFTVVEVLNAAAILLVALLAVAGTLPTGSTNVDEGGRISIAVARAQQTLEVIKNSSFPPTSGSCSIYNVNVPTSYTCNVNVATLNGLATIRVTTTWTNSQRLGNVRLVTALAE